ncbi:MAG: chitobiase/beta-hexosaminidase C-terminal domain-containing protein [Verrucomicrobiales bacterium]
MRIETTANVHLSFTELEVFGSPYDPEPPAVEWASPGDGAFARELRSVEVIFSEPVSGVEVSDLLVNGEPATAMQPVTDRYYIFAFDPAAEGAASVAFAANNQIVDRFGNALPATAWSVTIDPALPAPRLAITEFLASNKGGLEDADGDSPDWIEITNIGAVTANLGGWFLTDDAADLTRWRLPATTLAPGESLIVFASDKDRAFPGQELHANFKLDADGGYLALVWPDGAAVASDWTYGEQETNISTGTGQRFRDTPLVAADAASRFVIPAGEIPGWAAVGFDDAAWQGGTAALGYEAADAPGGFGPLAWFDFNDATDPAVAADRSGNGNGGLIRNATYTADGGGRTGNAGDRALDFPGNGSVDLATAALGAFDAIERANGITLTLWCYGAPQQPAANYIFMARPEIGSSFRALDAHLPWSDSTIYFDSGGCCDLGLHRIFINDPDPQNWRGAWNHYAFVKDGDLKQIWQNGVLLTDGENSAPLTVFREFYLGAENAAGTVGYRGTIDDFAMFDGALDAAAIEAIAAGASPLGARSAAAYFDTDLGAMRGANASAFVRIPFAIDDPSAHALLSLRMQYSDGFAAYLNGTEVARRNAPAGDLAFDGSALGSRPASAAFAAEAIDLSGFSDLLVSGQNVLAFHGLNAAAGDGGFLLRAELFSGARLDGRLMVPPTPGAPNASGVTGFVADTKFAPDRGFYEEPVEVTITCATPGAMIAYTTDGSEPTPDNGTQGASPLAVTVAATTPLRARAFDPAGELGPTNVDTHTYLFLDGVAAQAKPDSAPDLWPGNHPADFTMDARVAENALPGYSLREALEDLPSLMVTAPPADLWGANGIYRNSGGRGKNWERAASGEWLDPQGGPGFQVEFGLRIHGNISRNKGFTPKHGFKMCLRERYGDASLRSSRSSPFARR